MNELCSWQPTISLANLKKRTAIIHLIRDFFAKKGVLEVETPAMSYATVTDIHLFPFHTQFLEPGARGGKTLYLMTSPEYHMKRLLAAGSGAIYQLARCFRNEEHGRYHNPEFTLLEWYRPGFDLALLMMEVDELLTEILHTSKSEMLSYQHAFMRYLALDPLTAGIDLLRNVACSLELKEVAEHETDIDTLLQLLFTVVIEPHLGLERPTFIYHFPASQAALAKLNTIDHRIAERFEVYFKGVELANGFHELTDCDEQRQRFELDNKKRAEKNLPQHPIDEHLLAALSAGLPDCSGVALGVDRLIMLALDADKIADVIAFPVTRA